MADEIKNSALVERVRQAVIKLGGSVTVGDIVSATGLSSDEAKSGLDSLIITHEGTMRVSERGEIMYAFARGVIRRDRRSWWERNKEALLSIFKTLVKILIMLVLVIYFIIYLVILIAILFAGNNNNNNRQSSSSGGGDLLFWGIYLFWGRGTPDYSLSSQQKKKDPLYTRIFRFIFGPEEEKLDPLESKTKCAQLIRARKGVICVEDWMMVSGQSKSQCESDLAKFTAEFSGNVEITDNGTLIYIFEDMMKSSAKQNFSPSILTNISLEKYLPLIGNKNGGNGVVIGLNSFNLIMAAVITYFGHNILAIDDPSQAILLETSPILPIINWLGIVPLIFSALIFSGPLIRMPFNKKENARRRQRNIQKLVTHELFNGNEIPTQLNIVPLTNRVNSVLEDYEFIPASDLEIKQNVETLCDELDGELSSTSNVYVFHQFDDRIDEVRKIRSQKRLDRQDLGRVVFSTDNDEQERVDSRDKKEQLDAFDRALDAATGAGYDYGYSSDSSHQSRQNRSHY